MNESDGCKEVEEVEELDVLGQNAFQANEKGGTSCGGNFQQPWK